jgi:hypothetical protein
MNHDSLTTLVTIRDDINIYDIITMLKNATKKYDGRTE